jgi:hypothetical protein
LILTNGFSPASDSGTLARASAPMIAVAAKTIRRPTFVNIGFIEISFSDLAKSHARIVFRRIAVAVENGRSPNLGGAAPSQLLLKPCQLTISVHITPCVLGKD